MKYSYRLSRDGSNPSSHTKDITLFKVIFFLNVWEILEFYAIIYINNLKYFDVT